MYKYVVECPKGGTHFSYDKSFMKTQKNHVATYDQIE